MIEVGQVLSLKMRFNNSGLIHKLLKFSFYFADKF